MFQMYVTTELCNSILSLPISDKSEDRHWIYRMKNLPIDKIEIIDKSQVIVISHNKKEV